MFRYKSNKQAIIIAALVILVCLVCLTGATLAIFTSNQGDGTIGIISTSGNIKVNILDAVSGESLVGHVLEFQTNSMQKKLYFEPGATFYTQGFRVANDGNIPINFSLSVSEDASIDMTEFKEAFDVWIVPASELSREGGEKLTKFQSKLAVGQSSEVYHLVIQMKETAGNEFQGKSYSGIGITVYAVQGNALLNGQE